MPISPARLTAFDILLRIDTQDAYSSELLHSERLADLSPQDRGLCMEIVMGVLRWRSRIDALIARLSFTPFRKLDQEVVTALRMGVYQVQYLERIPARAAINESVDLVKHARKTSAAPLVNAVLRKIPKSSNAERAALHSASPVVPESRDIAPAALASEFAHPQWLVERWIARYGIDHAACICRYDQQIPATTLRLRDAAAERDLEDAWVGLAPGALLKSACRVVEGDPLRTFVCEQHRAVIQDEGSQLVAALVGKGKRILDCCAAPGGKTAAIADRNPQSEIIAAELHEHRANLMRKLLRTANVQVIHADACALPLTGTFERILADVPCSGTGTLARNPEIKWRLKTEDLADLHKRQVSILRAALGHLAPGGRLIYSTCSLEAEENEQVIEEVLASKEVVAPSSCPASPVRVIEVQDELRRLQREGELICSDLDSITSGHYLRTIPGVQPCDGFFAAILERP